MPTQEITRMPATGTAPAARVIDELDQIVGKSRRNLSPHPARRRVRDVVAGWLEHLVSSAPPPEGSGLPPQIRFPFY
ncbi:MAG TPA: hypothetical protein VNV18_10735 [Stellaceae bacterium]|jgi:hypothetical protein|nr:hypothetical protein [Stellaceae bacterium]